MKTIHLPTMRLPRLASAPGRLLGWKESRLGENTISLLHCKDRIGRLKNEPELLALHSNPRGLALLWVQWLEWAGAVTGSVPVPKSPQVGSMQESGTMRPRFWWQSQRQDGDGNKDKTRCVRGVGGKTALTAGRAEISDGEDHWVRPAQCPHPVWGARTLESRRK